MKKLVICIFCFPVYIFSCTTIQKSQATLPAYEIVKDTETKVLKGKINRALIETDTTFGWFKENMKWGTANKKAVELIKIKKADLHFIVFAGTWCEDTQNLLPVFYRMIDKAEFPDNKIVLYGTDRDKKTLLQIEQKYSVINVPTFIVMYKNKEIGRVVEFGKYGDIEKEIAEILSLIN
jgi:thiol-disulfide isomerase/thioredoxin